MIDGRATRMPPFGARLRGLFDEAWTRARRRRRRIALAGAVVCAAAAALAIGPSGGGTQRPASPSRAPGIDAAAPRTVGADDDVPVTFTARHATGVVGRSGHVYSVTAMAVAPKAACVNSRDAYTADGIAAGTRVTLTLAVRRGEGGLLGWCPGRYRGRIVYGEGFRCPAKGRCQIPAGFPHREVVVARFAYRVPARSRRVASTGDRSRIRAEAARS